MKTRICYETHTDCNGDTCSKDAPRNYAIQCTDRASGKVGSFTFDEAAADRDGYFTATSPVCRDLDELFKWAKAEGVALQCRIYNFPASVAA